MTVIRDIRVDAIVIGKRLRPLSDATVNEIAESLTRVGQINPVSVFQPNARPTLIAGHHRLAAAKRLGWETIKCLILPSDMTEDDLLLSEIDENLARGELSLAERGLHVRVRQEIYERKNGPAKAVGGIARAVKAGQKVANANSALASFTKDTASKTGQSVRKVQVDAQRARAIPNIADVVGTSLDKGEELDALAKLPVDKQDEVIAKAKAGEKVSAKVEAKKVKRAEVEQATAAKIVALPVKKYGVIYADPEWKFKAFSEETTNHGPQDHYSVSETEDIAKRDVQSIAHTDCVLFLWATVPMLPDALKVMDAWGFQYKSQIVWVKDRAGTGYWTRNKHEILLIGTRGKPTCPAPGENPESVVIAPVGAHSEKPERFAEIIECLYPNIPKIELNRRGPARHGWDAWGAETEVREETEAA
jgi:N6-adenosine-specific RNA methylase IME4/uncharacterized ParB-like nuclease family protein